MVGVRDGDTNMSCGPTLDELEEATFGTTRPPTPKRLDAEPPQNYSSPPPCPALPNPMRPSTASPTGSFPSASSPERRCSWGAKDRPSGLSSARAGMRGVDVIIVYDPSGEKPTADALLHALSPLAGLPGDRCPPPLDAPPNAVAFHFAPQDEAGAAPQGKADVSPGPAHSAPRAGIEAWLDKTRLEGMLWAGLDDARAGGKHARDVIMAVFDGANVPGRKLLIATQIERGLSPAEAARQASQVVHSAVSHGGRLLFQVVDTPAQVRATLETGGVLGTHGPLLDAVLAGDVPEGHVRAFLFEDAAVCPRLVAVRSPGERAAEAKEEEQEAILQAVLDRVGEDVRAQHAARRQRGNAAHNLAILVEELAGES